MTIVELAESTGLDRNRISAWEQGKGVPRDRGRLMELAEALGLDSNEERDFAAAAGEFRQQLPKREKQKRTILAKSTQAEERLIYNSRYETQPFFDWLLVSEGERYSEKIRFFRRAEDDLWTVEVRSLGSEVVGVNKSIGSTIGRIEFDYKSDLSQTNTNVVIYAIPRKEIWTGRVDIIEAGSEPGIAELERKNCRQSFAVPTETIQDNKWHRAVLPFDFRNLPGVVYTVLAPRVNEGCKDKGIGHLLISDIQVIV